MNLQELTDVHDEITEEALERQVEKAPDFAPESDVLANYKATKGVWGILFRLEDQLKTVRQFKQTNMIPKDMVREAVMDSINYLVGIWALIEDSEEIPRGSKLKEDQGRGNCSA